VLINRNKKSEIILLSEGYVLKKYLTDDAEERILQDQSSLLLLMDKFDHIIYDGWEVRTLKLFWVGTDQKSIGLEYVKGSTIANLPENDLYIAERLYGIWLGHYELSVMGDSEYGPLYTDLSLHNAIMDYENKQFVVIDPGKHFGRMGYIYEDMIQHSYSIFVHCIRHYLNPFRYLNQFIDSFHSTRSKNFKIPRYYFSIFRDTKSRLILRMKKPRSLISYIGGLLLVCPIYFIYIPLYMTYKNLLR
jgi:hypothetical protein